MKKFDSGEYQDKFSDYYQFISKLGKGAFGTVVLALDKYSGEEVAVKILQKNSIKRSYIQELRREAEIMAALNHPNIVKFKHMKETQRRIFLVMEAVHGSNLKRFIKKTPITESLAHYIFTHILDAVKYMHTRNVVHRDLKPENILVARTDPLCIKIADFGLSAQHEQHWSQSMLTGKCGTLLFMAPEQVFTRYYSKPVDIWSCAIILYILLTNGSHPLFAPKESAKSYLKKLKEFSLAFPETFPAPAKCLIEKMTVVAPLGRYTASQAASHPWVLQQSTAAPLTALEELALYEDQLKLKSVLYVAAFATLCRPPAPTTPVKQPPPPMATVKAAQRLTTFMSSTKSWKLKTLSSRDRLHPGTGKRTRQVSPCSNASITPRTSLLN